MERSYYSLRIATKECNYNKVSEILNVTPFDLSKGWIHEIEKSDTGYFDFINFFLDILEDNYERLIEIGISRENISIWWIYGYNGQCNFEFLPKDLKRLGENEISFCLSCYEEGY
jgi:hypothetical protein